MPSSKSKSPVDWYIGSYLIRFVELEAKNNDDPNAKFMSWENTIIVQARSFKKAYKKIVAVAQEYTQPYRGGDKAVRVQWKFVGVTELLPIYEPLKDGAEIMWADHKPKKLRNLKKRIKSCKQLEQ